MILDRAKGNERKWTNTEAIRVGRIQIFSISPKVYCPKMSECVNLTYTQTESAILYLELMALTGEDLRLDVYLCQLNGSSDSNSSFWSVEIVQRVVFLLATINMGLFLGITYDP